MEGTCTKLEKVQDSYDHFSRHSAKLPTAKVWPGGTETLPLSNGPAFIHRSPGMGRGRREQKMQPSHPHPHPAAVSGEGGRTGLMQGPLGLRGKRQNTCLRLPRSAHTRGFSGAEYLRVSHGSG